MYCIVWDIGLCVSIKDIKKKQKKTEPTGRRCSSVLNIPPKWLVERIMLFGFTKGKMLFIDTNGKRMENCAVPFGGKFLLVFPDTNGSAPMMCHSFMFVDFLLFPAVSLGLEFITFEMPETPK